MTATVGLFVVNVAVPGVGLMVVKFGVGLMEINFAVPIVGLVVVNRAVPGVGLMVVNFAVPGDGLSVGTLASSTTSVVKFKVSSGLVMLNPAISIICSKFKGTDRTSWPENTKISSTQY